LYPDVYTNHVLVERGQSAVRVLEALGVEVAIPDVGESGRAPLSQGMMETARRNAEKAADVLEHYVEDGHDIVVIEPSDLAMFRRDYDRLLPNRDESISGNTYEIMEYVYGLLENEADAEVLVPGQGRPLAYHSHCQLRTLGLDVYTEAIFDRLDYDVVTSDVECCGMAGSFGYKSQYFDLAMAVGESLAEQLDDPSRQLVASGTSCQEQLDSLLDREARHPVEIVDPWTT
jgi:Fe-S oxidoreductase